MFLGIGNFGVPGSKQGGDLSSDVEVSSQLAEVLSKLMWVGQHVRWRKTDSASGRDSSTVFEREDSSRRSGI
jgi:hypothetical protein